MDFPFNPSTMHLPYTTSISPIYSVEHKPFGQNLPAILACYESAPFKH